MAPMFGQWRAAMQAPQQNAYQTGTGFPTQNAQGGWQMPRSVAPQAPAPQPQAPQAAAPMMGTNAFMNYWNSPQLGMGLKSIPDIGAAQQQAYMQGLWSPGMANS